MTGMIIASLHLLKSNTFFFRKNKAKKKKGTSFLELWMTVRSVHARKLTVTVKAVSFI